jgi:hypothetical protein
MVAAHRVQPFLVLLLVVAILQLSLPATGFCQAASQRNATVYVPVYSMVYTGDRAVPVNLASTLSIRNTDLQHSIRIISADYYSAKGQLVRKMLARPLLLKPLAATSIFIREKDTTGGFNSSFIVRWDAAGPVAVPIIQCINIGAYSGLGISFVNPGQVVR